uniref:Uncharacterized protein n=1 Tax=Octopus bimaculoides TaxID=37653 RepID=A0A0L8H7U9_OCTBM
MLYYLGKMLLAMSFGLQGYSESDVYGHTRVIHVTVSQLSVNIQERSIPLITITWNLKKPTGEVGRREKCMLSSHSVISTLYNKYF